jgi:hypothetical protein
VPNSTFAVAAEILDKRRRIAPHRICRGVDVDVRVLGRDGDCFIGPGIADMATDDDKFWKIERNTTEVDRSPDLGGHQGARMSDLCAERHAG